MKKIVRIATFIPMLYMMFLIWGFSANSGEVSSGQSQGIVSHVIDFVEDVTDITLSKEEQFIWEERIHTPVRKMAHITEYMIFALTVAFPFSHYLRNAKMIRRFTFIFCILYASTDEIHQRFIPGRSGQFRDVIIDGIGIGMGIFIYSLVKRKISKSNGTDNKE